MIIYKWIFFFSSRRRHTRQESVSWARRCVQETDAEYMGLHLGKKQSSVQAELSHLHLVYVQGGTLGHGDTFSTNINLPTILESISEQKFTSIACGNSHMAAINDKGEMQNLFTNHLVTYILLFRYTWGNPDHGKLGHAEVESKAFNRRDFTPRNHNAPPPPSKVQGDLVNTPCTQVACGSLHTISLTHDGRVYSWGSNKRGVLGYESSQDVTLPKKIDYFDNKNIVKIAAGFDFNIALSAEGKLYSWGNNDYGQLGNARDIYQANPAELRVPEKFIDVSCGENYAAAITNKGELFTWGYGSDGQLGQGSRADVKSPKLVEFEKSIRQVSCGGGHTAVITTDGQLYMFGRGREGQLGRGEIIESSASYRTSPQLVNFFAGMSIRDVRCGADHTLALVDEATAAGKK
eukprot:TRINITY_DN1119_c0_g1_i1.p1 TRINITY_DN1119_c0_g1~~TRINITY_DN1119_c0_g1_i1.p1  ORF type:complete len:406 (-),score=89.66 TRINITY_DN1119_c0_g1_i1:164-1381(-)